MEGLLWVRSPQARELVTKRWPDLCDCYVDTAIRHLRDCRELTCRATWRRFERASALISVGAMSRLAFCHAMYVALRDPSRTWELIKKGVWGSGEKGAIDATGFGQLFPTQAHDCCVVGAPLLVGVRCAIIGTTYSSHEADIFALQCCVLMEHSGRLHRVRSNTCACC